MITVTLLLESVQDQVLITILNFQMIMVNIQFCFFAILIFIMISSLQNYMEGKLWVFNLNKVNSNLPSFQMNLEEI